MTRFLEGKTAIVTGGTRGIGRAIAEALLREGANVAICGRSKENVEQARQEMATMGRVVGAVADVADAKSVSEFFNFLDGELGKLHILVNNAGIGIFRSIGDMSAEEWKATIDTNLNGVFYCCREAILRMKSSNGASIINISSLAGRNPFAGGAAYNASKFGLNGMSEATMLDHRYDNIRVSYVMPGSVDTEFGSHSGDSSWRMRPEDVADVVLMILRMPQRTTVSRVEMRPSLPPR